MTYIMNIFYKIGAARPKAGPRGRRAPGPVDSRLSSGPGAHEF